MTLAVTQSKKPRFGIFRVQNKTTRDEEIASVNEGNEED
jgi:hypothetical protein